MEEQLQPEKTLRWATKTVLSAELEKFINDNKKFINDDKRFINDTITINIFLLFVGPKKHGSYIYHQIILYSSP